MCWRVECVNDSVVMVVVFKREQFNPPKIAPKILLFFPSTDIVAINTGNPKIVDRKRVQEIWRGSSLVQKCVNLGSNVLIADRINVCTGIRMN